MKSFKLILIAFLSFSTISFFACNTSEENVDNGNEDSTEIVSDINAETPDSTENVKSQDELGKEYTAKYTCPDHCKGSGSDKEGECLNCEMELMENPNFESE